jgi:hypothetical protein
VEVVAAVHQAVPVEQKEVIVLLAHSLLLKAEVLAVRLMPVVVLADVVVVLEQPIMLLQEEVVEVVLAELLALVQEPVQAVRWNLEGLEEKELKEVLQVRLQIITPKEQTLLMVVLAYLALAVEAEVDLPTVHIQKENLQVHLEVVMVALMAVLLLLELLTPEEVVVVLELHLEGLLPQERLAVQATA